MGTHLSAALTRANVLKALTYVVCWAVVAIPASYLFFFHDSQPTVIAGHDVTVAPTHDGYATADFGAYLPNFRYPTDSFLGVRVDVGKTNLDNYDALLQRYAIIASSPDGELSKVGDLVKDMLIASLLKGALAGLVGPALWIVIGPRRRRELRADLSHRRIALIAVGGVVVILAGAAGPLIDRSAVGKVTAETWEPLQTLFPDRQLPDDAQNLQVQRGLITSGTQRLIQSAIASFDTSQTYYKELEAQVATIAPQIRQPTDGETVALLVTDRHDNIGMDRVARAIGDAGGATVLFDAGDDTSTGEAWESFSLDSLAETFEDYDEKFQVPGNHDNGDFIGDYLSDEGFVVLDGEPLETEQRIRLLGAPDPRSSGLGNWRTTSGISFDDQAAKLADIACAANDDGEPIATILVHDAKLGQPALERGCTDLVLAGHLHVQVGPDEVLGDNGASGWTYTNGTTGGAAYAVALGSKLRRDAQVTLVTYRDGRPIGLQPITISPVPEFEVSPYVELRPSP